MVTLLIVGVAEVSDFCEITDSLDAVVSKEFLTCSKAVDEATELDLLLRSDPVFSAISRSSSSFIHGCFATISLLRCVADDACDWDGVVEGVCDDSGRRRRAPNE